MTKNINEIEVEVKALVDAKQVDIILWNIFDLVKRTSLLGNFTLSSEKQLNHYFEGDVSSLSKIVDSQLFDERDSVKQIIKGLISDNRTFSIRTRQSSKLSNPLLVIKFSGLNGDADNGTSRPEFEVPCIDLSLDQLDEKLVKLGAKVKSKWSRERRTISTDFHGMPISFMLDKNSGYGFVLELETLSDEEDEVGALTCLRSILGLLDLVELPKERLDRMFAHYNEKWKSYYQKEKFFIVE